MRSEGNGAGRKVAGGGKRERDRNAARHLDRKSERQRKTYTYKHKGKICRGIRGNRQDPERDNNEPILLDCQHPSHHEGP